MTLDNASDEPDEGAGRPADLEAAAAKQRNDESAGDRRVKAALR
jgi:hypothetical protein